MRTSKSKKFKANTVTSVEIKVEPPESHLNNDDILLDANFVSEGHSSGAVEIKKEIENNYESYYGEPETYRLDSEIKIEYEETDLKTECMNETNEISDVDTLKSNIKDYENIFVLSTEEVVNKEEERKTLNEDSPREVAEDKSDVTGGHFEFIAINHSESFEENSNHLEENVDSYRHVFVHSRRKTNKEKEPLKCDVCGKLFSQKGGLKRHSLTHTGEKPHKCEICGKSFSLKVNLKTHMLIHTDEKSHKCDICEKLFSRKQDLKIHMLTHTGEKPYKCHICEKLFGRIHNLNSHKLIHSGEKPHECDICGKLFRRSEELKRHSKIHTDEKPFKCDICGNFFRRKEDLKRHSSKHK